MRKEQNILKGALIVIALILAALLFWLKPDEPFKILALIGALSWLSILADLLIKLFIKPIIKIIPDKEIEIGYTTNGPIINPQLALLSENKPSLINKIEIELKHENNDTHLFTWEWFEETLYEVNLPERSIPTRKNQKAVAIKINSGEMIEKKIGFHDNTFKTEYSRLIKLSNERFLNVFQQPQPNKQTFLTSNEFNALNDNFRNSFIWRLGRYKLKYKVYLIEREKPFELESEFELSNLDIRSLQNNIEKCKKHMEYNYQLIEEWPKFDWIIIKTK